MWNCTNIPLVFVKCMCFLICAVWMDTWNPSTFTNALLVPSQYQHQICLFVKVILPSSMLFFLFDKSSKNALCPVHLWGPVQVFMRTGQYRTIWINMFLYHGICIYSMYENWCFNHLYRYLELYHFISVTLCCAILMWTYICIHKYIHTIYTRTVDYVHFIS